MNSLRGAVSPEGFILDENATRPFILAATAIGEEFFKFLRDR